MRLICLRSWFARARSEPNCDADARCEEKVTVPRHTATTARMDDIHRKRLSSLAGRSVGGAMRTTSVTGQGYRLWSNPCMPDLRGITLRPGQRGCSATTQTVISGRHRTVWTFENRLGACQIVPARCRV